MLILYGVIFFKKLIKKVGIMGNQDLFIVIVLTGFIFIIIYVIKHPTNKSSSSSSGKLMEADNVGMRCDTAIDGKAYFLSLFQKEPEPIIFYLFNNKDKAIQALAEVSCITIAEDSRKLISTDIIKFGVFPTVDEGDSPTWGTLLAGKNLSHDTWSEARKCFKKYGGIMRRENKPGNGKPIHQKN